MLLDLLWKHLLGQQVSWLEWEGRTWPYFLTTGHPLSETVTWDRFTQILVKETGSIRQCPPISIPSCHSGQKTQDTNVGVGKLHFPSFAFSFPQRITHQFVHPSFVQGPDYCLLGLASPLAPCLRQAQRDLVSTYLPNCQISWEKLLKMGNSSSYRKTFCSH